MCPHWNSCTLSSFYTLSPHTEVNHEAAHKGLNHVCVGGKERLVWSFRFSAASEVDWETAPFPVLIFPHLRKLIVWNYKDIPIKSSFQLSAFFHPHFKLINLMNLTSISSNHDYTCAQSSLTWCIRNTDTISLHLCQPSFPCINIE